MNSWKYDGLNAKSSQKQYILAVGSPIGRMKISANVDALPAKVARCVDVSASHEPTVDWMMMCLLGSTESWDLYACL